MTFLIENLAIGRKSLDDVLFRGCKLLLVGSKKIIKDVNRDVHTKMFIANDGEKLERT